MALTMAAIVFIIGCLIPTSTGNQMATHPQEHASCDKATCASVVSYCMIQGTCNCNPSENCSCCAECALCLGDLYRHCCDCVGMRKGTNYTAGIPTITSTVAVLDDPSPALFNSLTQQPMPKLRYSILRFPIVEELAAHRHRLHHHNRHHDRHSNQGHEETIRKPARSDFTSQTYWNDVQVVMRSYNLEIGAESSTLCTVAYWDECLALHQCILSCTSMGASSYRWFHNGCCECAGPSCLNYGNMYINCKRCMQ